MLGVADTTLKTHLRRLFEKTGTNRQADLVKLVRDIPCHYPDDAIIAVSAQSEKSNATNTYACSH